ncbi:hypothetical protein ZIOFF_045683 [Zingiber officinale]|uniref:Centromere protein O n=1 Tax=Zingiber officinale TaxID=94328 RepID=A0A8J5GDD4_ZINOF|nr:hypothetical protein ZIOFF_045683 [Zingiber officinale]
MCLNRFVPEPKSFLLNDQEQKSKDSEISTNSLQMLSSDMQQIEQLKRRSHALTGEVNFAQEEDIRLETTRARLSNVLKRHEELTERLSSLQKVCGCLRGHRSFLVVSDRLRKSCWTSHGSFAVILGRDSDKIIFERLEKEFDAARTAQTEAVCHNFLTRKSTHLNHILLAEISLDEEQWNDGLLATIREKVHMEAERKAMSNETCTPLDPLIHAKITYKMKNKVICCLEGARIGIQFETYFAGEPCETYHCVLESKSFLEKMSVIEHTVPFFLPIREAENDLLSSNAIKFVDYVGEILQSYVDRREQVRLIKELYGNQIGELFHSLSYNLIEFVLEDFDCKVTVSLRYADLVSILPSRIRVLAWPVHPSKKTLADEKKGGAQSIPSRLPYAEDALRTMSLPEGELGQNGLSTDWCSQLDEASRQVEWVCQACLAQVASPSLCRDCTEPSPCAATNIPSPCKFLIFCKNFHL